MEMASGFTVFCLSAIRLLERSGEGVRRPGARQLSGAVWVLCAPLCCPELAAQGRTCGQKESRGLEGCSARKCVRMQPRPLSTKPGPAAPWVTTRDWGRLA